LAHNHDTTNWNYTYAGSDDVDEVAWYDDNSSEKSHFVGAKSSNSLGLYDMSGNVNEYCYDSTSSKAIFKGGSWFDADYDDISPFLCKIYFNDTIVKSNTANYIGFRLCRSIIE
jgi:formylglycine-generating enzyme required for sulfatase activity